jgi:hypothetical protein
MKARSNTPGDPLAILVAILINILQIKGIWWLHIVWDMEVGYGAKNMEAPYANQNRPLLVK